MRIVTSVFCLFLFTFYVAAQERRASPRVLKPIYIEGKGGFADESGKVVIQPQFDEVHPFSEGLAVVAIGTMPKPVMPEIKANILYEFTIIRDDLKWGYIDETGKIVVPLQFRYADDFSEGLASVRVKEKWGYIDKSGKVVIKPRFFEGNRFIGGRAWVSIGKLKMVGKLKPDFSLDVLRFYGKHGHVDRSGKFTETSFEEWYSRGARANNSFNRSANSGAFMRETCIVSAVRRARLIRALDSPIVECFK